MKKLLSALLCAALIFGEASVFASAEGVATNDAQKSEAVSVDTVSESEDGFTAIDLADVDLEEITKVGIDAKASNTTFLKQTLPKDNSSIKKGGSLYVEFLLRDTWRYYYTVPVTIIASSDGRKIYKTYLGSRCGLSGWYRYTGTLNLSSLSAGSYTLWVFAAPCNSSGTPVSNWTSFDNMPYIKTPFKIGSSSSSDSKVTAGATTGKAGKLATGTNKVTQKKSTGYVKFTAPSSGKYTFTISNISDSGKNDSVGEWSVYKKSNPLTVTTEGGKSDVLYVAGKNTDISIYNDGQSKVNQYLKKRSAQKISLSKGDVLYFCLDYDENSTTYEVSVKKN